VDEPYTAGRELLTAERAEANQGLAARELQDEDKGPDWGLEKRRERLHYSTIVHSGACVHLIPNDCLSLVRAPLHSKESENVCGSRATEAKYAQNA
jgi:hypothetical protein